MSAENSKLIKFDDDYIGIGLPEKALEFSIYEAEELLAFLQFQQYKFYQDIENGDNYTVFYRNVKDLVQAWEIIEGTRNEIEKIFAPEPIAISNKLGFWRIVYNTKQKIEEESGRKVNENDYYGAHYKAEQRKEGSIIRAKGKSLSETQELFMEAIKDCGLDFVPNSRKKIKLPVSL